MKDSDFISRCWREGQVIGIEADAVTPDGAKCYSQDENRSCHLIQATLGEDTADELHSLLYLSVSADLDNIDAELYDIDAVTDDAMVVTDGDRGIVTAFIHEAHGH